MISDELYNLSDMLLSHAARGEATPPERMAIFSMMLHSLSKRVAAMEDRPIPPSARLPLMPDETDDVAMLVAKGWTEDDARSFVGEDPREGGGEP